MKECSCVWKPFVFGLAVLFSLGLIATAAAQDAMEAKETAVEEKASAEEEMLEGVVEVEEQVVTGARQPRSVTDSAVPVDVVRGDEDPVEPDVYLGYQCPKYNFSL